MIFLIPLISGFSIVISMVQNSRLASFTSIKQCTLINFITGLLGSSFLFFISGASLSFLNNFTQLPLIAYIGGILGVIVVMLATITIRHISIISSNMLMYFGQLLMGLLIDFLRQTNLSPVKLLGCLCILIGIMINGYLDNKMIQIKI